MAAVGTRNDGLRLKLGGNEFHFLGFVGALSGVVVLASAARNGVGSGRLLCSGGMMQWQAPGSATPGAAVNVSAGGAFLVEDGEDASKWLRIHVYPAYLPLTGQARVLMQDRFNELGPDDVDASDALAGETETVEFTLHNVSGNAIVNAKLWIDPAGSGAPVLEVSDDGVTFVAPDSELHADVLVWPLIAVGESKSIWIRRTIGAATGSVAEALNLLQWAWLGA